MILGASQITSHTLDAALLGDDLPLDPKTATIILDESWSPYGQITLVCPVSAELIALDPTVDHFVDVTLRQSYGRLLTVGDLSKRWAGRPLSALSLAYRGIGVGGVWYGDLGGVSRSLFSSWSNPGDAYEATARAFVGMMLRARTIDHVGATVTLTLATVDAKLHDHTHTSDTVPELFAPAGTDRAHKAVRWVLGYIDAELDDVPAAALIPDFDIQANPWRTGSTAWDYLSPILQRADLRLWCDEAGLWHLRTDQPTPPDVVELSGTRTITAASDTIDLDQSVTESVLVVYQWTDSAGVAQTAYDAAQVPGSSRLPYVVTYYRPFPGKGAAARILKSRLARSRRVPVAAVSDYRVQPGMPITLDLPDTSPLAGVVSATTWRFPADEMNVVTRDVALA
jgi:IS5 family transposase